MPRRPFDELIQESPLRMTPEEQAYMYETLKNILVTRGKLDPKNMLAAPPIEQLMSRHVLPEYIEKLQGDVQAAPPTKVGSTPSIEKEADPSFQDMFVHGPSAMRTPNTSLGQLREALPEAVSGVVGDFFKRLDPEKAASSFLEGGKPRTPAEAHPPTDQPQVKKPPSSPMEETKKPVKSVLSARIGPNGKVTFTNVEVSPEDQKSIAEAEAMYKKGVDKWKGKALEEQAMMDMVGGEPLVNGTPLSKIVVPPGQTKGDFRVRPGEGSLVLGGTMLTPLGAPEGWDNMTPGARDEYLRQSGGLLPAQQAAAQVSQEQSKARDLEDPVNANFRNSDEIKRRGEQAAVQNKAKADAMVAAAEAASPRPFTDQERALAQARAAESIIKQTEEEEKKRLGMSTPETSAAVQRGGLVP